MKNKNIFSVIFIIVFIFLVFFLINSSYSNHLKIDNIKSVKINEVSINVEVASTVSQQETGLSFRDSLGENNGMLFIFKKPAKYSFWMKNMNFPIDIIWINDDMKVVYIEKNVKTETYPQAFSPSEESLYVLEVNSGFSEKNNLIVGNKVKF